MKHPGLKFLLFLFLLPGPVFGQLRLSGLSRTVFQGQSLSGNWLRSDTLSDRRTQNGYALFDLRAAWARGESFSFFFDTRLKNRIGGFGGIAMGMELRQIRIKGNIRDRFRYALGDVDVEISPLTFRNEPDPAPVAGLPVFEFRQNVSAYENFNLNSCWRMRGADAAFRLPAGKKLWLENRFLALTDRDTPSLKKGFSSRMGWIPGLVFPGRGELHGNVLQFSDSLGGGSRIRVSGGRGRFRLKWKSIVLGLKGEWQYSLSRRDAASGLINRERRDIAFTAGTEFLFREKHALSLQVMETGPFFESPGAQSLRFTSGRPSDFLPFVRNAGLLRTPLLLDRIGSERMQNRNLSPARQPVYLPYSLVLPYGEATPNRRGIGFAVRSMPFRQLRLESSGFVLSEVLGEGNTARRSFFMITSRATLQTGSVPGRGWGRGQILLFHRFESSARGGSLPVAARIHSAGAGFSTEIRPGFELLGSLGWLRSQGREWQPLFHTGNEAYAYANTGLDVEEWLAGGGLRWYIRPRCLLWFSSYFTSRKSPYTAESGTLIQHYAQFSYAF